MRSLGVALCLAACSAFGQLPPLTEQVDVHVVNVDVSVTDGKGNPVTGLTQSDFEIVEDGHAQKITNFGTVRTALAGEAAALPAPARNISDARRKILLIVDNNYLPVPERNHALDTIEKYFDSSFTGEWAIAAIGRNAEVLQPFTSEKRLVSDAIAKVRTMPSETKQHAIDRSVLSEKFIRTGDETVSDDFKEKVAFSGREQTFRALMAMQNTARAVVDTARGYAAEPGKKFIILVTGGIENNTMYAAYAKENDFEARELRQQIDYVAEAMVREANAANFTVHIINAATRGMAAPQHDVSNHSSGITAGALLRNFGSDPIDVADVDSIPLSIALGTGGMYLPANDVMGSLQKIDAITSTIYSLGYSPNHTGDRQYHAISVRVKRPGVHVANRSGYFDDTPEDRLQQVLRARMSFDPGFSSLPVRVNVGGAAQREDDLLVPVTAAMPLGRITVIPQDNSYVGRVHVYCSIFDENGRNIGFLHKTQEVKLAADQLQSSGDFRYTMKVRLQRGAFTVVMTLRDELSNEIGSASEIVHL